MYIVGAHMDGRGFGEATDDNGSGAALVMELARVLSGPDDRHGTRRRADHAQLTGATLRK
jgi:Zn-dependent M28 family amino/carboxypeptidase